MLPISWADEFTYLRSRINSTLHLLQILTNILIIYLNTFPSFLRNEMMKDVCKRPYVFLYMQEHFWENIGSETLYCSLDVHSSLDQSLLQSSCVEEGHRKEKD